MKKCPYFAEQIQDEAIVCRYCRRNLPAPLSSTQPAKPHAAAAPPKKQANSNRMIVGILVLVFLAYGLVMGVFAEVTATVAPTKTPITPQEDAWYSCTTFIEQQPGISFPDAQRYNPDGVQTLGGGEFLVKVYYAKIGTFYQCDLLHEMNGDMQLLNLNVAR